MQHGSLRHPWLIVSTALAIIFVILDFGAASIVVENMPVSPNMYFHHGLKPNFSTSAIWGDAGYRISTNSLGLKDRTSRQVPPDDGRRRLLYLGDSFTEGVGIPYEKTFVGIIDDRIRQTGDDTEVLNGGVISHSPYLYFLHLKDLIDRQGVRIDEVVVFIDVSDIQDELVYEDFKPGEITASLLMRYIKQFWQQHSLVGNVILTRSSAMQPYIDAIRSWMRAISRKEVSLQFLQPARAAQTVGMAADDHSSPLTRPHQEVWDNPNFYLQRDTWIDNDDAFMAWGKYGLHLARENLKRLVEYAEKKGIKVSFAIYPWPRFAHTESNRGREVWRKIASEEKWMLVDLYEDFAKTPDAAKSLFIPGDVHWNVQGHQFVAERWLAHYCQMRRATWCERLAK
jgi:hypothetical protein